MHRVGPVADGGGQPQATGSGLVTTGDSPNESTLVSIDLVVPGSKQRGRAFLPLGVLKKLDIGALAHELGRQFIEEDDTERLPLLKRALDFPTVTFETYRGETPPYELHAYVRAAELSDTPIFATVLAPAPVVEQLASTPPHIVLETATLQVITEELSTASIISALETWAKRIWAEIHVPRIVLSPWPGPTESRDGSVEILRLFPAPAEVGGAEFTELDPQVDFSPSPNLVAAEFMLDGEAA